MIYISHLLPDKQIREIIEKTGAGLESIEFSISENLDNFSECLRAYKARLQGMGVNELILHGPFLDLNPVAYDREIRRITMQRFALCYEAARELGAKKVVYHSCMYPQIYFSEGWADRMVDFYQEFLNTRGDIPVVMENVLDREPELLLETAEKLSHSAFGLCLDPGHAHCYSPVSVETWAKMLGPHVHHVHIHDNDGTRDAHAAIGEGSVPYESIFNSMEKKDKTFTIECNTEEAVLKSIQALRYLLKNNL